jgi:hypothetical protein
VPSSAWRARFGRDGLQPGDRVLLRLGNTVDFPVAFLGAVAADLVPVPTAAGLTEGEITRLARSSRRPPSSPRRISRCPMRPALPVLTDLRAMMEHAPGEIVHGRSRPACLSRLHLRLVGGAQGRRPRPSRDLGAAHDDDGWYGLTPEDRLLHAGAFNWTFTLGTGLLDPWAIGATALIPAPASRSRRCRS